MDPADLERLIDRELRSLPTPRAPRTLLPAVMAAANEAANRPWYSRTWLQWPVGWQLASAVVLLGVVAAGSVVPAAAARRRRNDQLRRQRSQRCGVLDARGRNRGPRPCACCGGRCSRRSCRGLSVWSP
jgi:hypothetical protein